MFGVGHLPEALIICFIVLLLVGGRQLPRLGKGLAEGVRELRHAAKPDAEEDAEPLEQT